MTQSEALRVIVKELEVDTLIAPRHTLITRIIRAQKIAEDALKETE